MKEQLKTCCTLLVSAATRLHLYGIDHPITRTAMGSFLSRLEQIFSSQGQFKLIVQQDVFYCNDQSYPMTMGSIYNLGKRLSSKKVGYLEFLPGLSENELADFCVQLADHGDTRITSQTHIKLGEIKIAPRDLRHELEAMRVQEPTGTRDDAVNEETRELETLYRHARQHLEIRMQNFDEVVFTFLTRFAREANPFLHLSELKSHNKYTFLHSSNVANLAIGFGLGVGLKGKDLYHIGIAALLHDVGKMYIPDNILSKAGKLTQEEWETIQRHPVEGARFLMKQKNVKHLACVVAFEHHLHYDGQGGYPVCTPPRLPSLPAQLVSICDSFDALFSYRSYHKKYDIMECLEILQNDRGTIYDPWLVDVFTRYITLNLEQRNVQGLS